MKQVVLASYAKGNPKADDFRVEEVPIPQPGEGEILLKTLWLALDPLIRFSLDEKLLSGATHMQIGEVIAAPAVCEVIASNHAFDTLLPERLRFEHGNPESLAEAIRIVLEADRQALGRTLRGTIVREHSVETWADRVVELAG